MDTSRWLFMSGLATINLMDAAQEEKGLYSSCSQFEAIATTAIRSST